jgi:putative colanic acid biosynthesis glycosyltransferase
MERSEQVLRLAFPVCVFAPGGVSQRRPAVGRCDQTRVRRELLGTGRLLCAAITATQCCAAAMKRHLPALYSLGRFRPPDISFRL